MRIVWTVPARRKRDLAIEYVAQESLRAAFNQLNEIDLQADRLLEQPNMGRPGKIRGTRELVIRHTPFIIGYRVKGDVVQIFRFLHGAQNR
jgi:toxin ParE1/3/4